MPSATLATGVSYEHVQVHSPTHIPLQHDASPVIPYHRVLFNASRPSTSDLEGLHTLNHPPLTAINTSFNQHQQQQHLRSPPTFNEIEHFFSTGSPSIARSRKRALSNSGTSIGSSADVHVYQYQQPQQQSYTIDNNTEAPQNGDFNDPTALSCTTATYSDSHHSGSQSNEELDMPFTTRNEAPQKRRRPARTSDTLITEKSARDKLGIAFNMLREVLPEHIRSMRCGRANFLGEASDWVRDIRESHDRLEDEVRLLREKTQTLEIMLQACSCGDRQQPAIMNHQIQTLQPLPTSYYNSGNAYATTNQF